MSWSPNIEPRLYLLKGQSLSYDMPIVDGLGRPYDIMDPIRWAAMTLGIPYELLVGRPRPMLRNTKRGQREFYHLAGDRAVSGTNNPPTSGGRNKAAYVAKDWLPSTSPRAFEAPGGANL